MTDISVIIVNYNVKEFLHNSIESIIKSSHGFNTEIIVVDNASSDGSAEYILKSFPDVKVIANKENLGFGKANNQALEIAKGKFLVIINPDTIVKEDSFRKVIEFFNNTPDAGMAGCKVLNPDGSLQLACRRSYPGPWVSFTKVTGLSNLFPKSRLFAQYNLTYLDENQTYEVDAISGSFMVLKREAYEKTGGFDPQFFMYGEDLDLCFRVKKAGYKVYYLHTTEIIHYKGESTKRSPIDETKHFYKAMSVFVNKHMSASLFINIILRTAIFLRRIIAFINIYRLVIFSAAADFILFNLFVYAAEHIYLSEKWTGFPDEYIPWTYIIPAAVQSIISFTSGVYQKKTLSVMKIIVALFIGLFTVSASTFFFKQFAYSRAVVLIMYSLAFAGLVLWRVFFKLFFKVGIATESKQNRTIVVGTGNSAIKIAEKLKKNISSIHKIIGLISSSMTEVGTKKDDYEVIGSIENIHKIVEQNKIDRIIFTSDEITFDKMFRAVSLCQGLNVEIKVSGSEKDYLVGKSSVTMLDNIPLLNLQYNILSPGHRITKRIVDLMISVPVLLFIFPFIYLISKQSAKQSSFSKFISGFPKVLSGKSSLVGPAIENKIKGIYLGKPGLTGFWFTEQFEPSAEEEEKLNIYYARNQNIWLDLEILGSTLSKFFFKGE